MLAQRENWCQVPAKRCTAFSDPLFSIVIYFDTHTFENYKYDPCHSSNNTTQSSYLHLLHLAPSKNRCTKTGLFHLKEREPRSCLDLLHIITISKFTPHTTDEIFLCNSIWLVQVRILPTASIAAATIPVAVPLPPSIPAHGEKPAKLTSIHFNRWQPHRGWRRHRLSNEDWYDAWHNSNFFCRNMNVLDDSKYSVTRISRP